MRPQLIARREAVPASARTDWNARITEHLLHVFQVSPRTVIGFCWPYRGEYDSRFAIRAWRDAGATAALPEVTARDQPLQFRTWSPGVPMRAGVYDIPVPDGTPIVLPDMAVVPMNAFDEHGYRLGYGGGFFDGTLQSLGGRVVAIGVAYELLRISSIFPQPHDIPMDFVATERGVYAAGGEPLQLLDAAAGRQRVTALLEKRGLPREARAPL